MIGTIDADVQRTGDDTLVIHGDAAEALQGLVGQAAGVIMGVSFDLATPTKVFEGCAIGRATTTDDFTMLRIKFLREETRRR